MKIEGFRERMWDLRQTEFGGESDSRISTAKAARQALLEIPVSLARKNGPINTIPVVMEAESRRRLINRTLDKLQNG